MIKLKL